MSDAKALEIKPATENVGNTTIEALMTKTVFAATPNYSVRQTIELLLEKKVSGVPVVDASGYLVTVVTEFDLMQFAAMGNLEATLGSLASKLAPAEKILTVKKNDLFKDAFKHFLLSRVRRVVVVGATGKVEGIVSRRDVMKTFLGPVAK